MAGVTSPPCLCILVENKTYGKHRLYQHERADGEDPAHGANDQSVINRLNGCVTSGADARRDAMKVIGEIDLHLMLAQAPAYGR